MTITLTLNQQQISELKAKHINYLVDQNPPYSVFQAKLQGCTITAYTSKKVVFQGINAQEYAKDYQEYSEVSKPKLTLPMGGSDEVGTGDYFGPVVVVACIVESDDEKLIKDLKVADSKTINDERIMEIAPILMQRLKYSVLILENKKYNIVHQKNNLNAIKAKLHNQAYLNLKRKYQLPKLCVIDQFTPETSYYRYLANETEIYKDLHFETKAESKYVAVACASIIARYAFLVSWLDMEKYYNFTFTKGAGAKVDNDIIEFVKKFGFDELNKVAKLHFKNTSVVKDMN